MKLYVASSWKNQFYDTTVAQLRKAGHDVWDWRNPPTGGNGFSWRDVKPTYGDFGKDVSTDEYQRMLKHPAAESGFMADLQGMTWAEACILLLPCGRSAHTEAGYMCGRGKPVHVLRMFDDEPDLMYLLFETIHGSMNALLEMLRDEPVPHALTPYRTPSEILKSPDEDSQRRVPRYPVVQQAIENSEARMKKLTDGGPYPERIVDTHETLRSPVNSRRRGKFTLPDYYHRTHPEAFVELLATVDVFLYEPNILGRSVFVGLSPQFDELDPDQNIAPAYECKIERMDELAIFDISFTRIADRIFPVMGLWYFWDETNTIRWGPYTSEDKAREALDYYANQL